MKLLFIALLLSLAAAKANASELGIEHSAGPVAGLGTRKLDNQKLPTYHGSLEDKFKTCLSRIYVSQMATYTSNGTFRSVTDDPEISKNLDCSGLSLSTLFATGEEFRVQARAEDQVWVVDQSKTIEKIE